MPGYPLLQRHIGQSQYRIIIFQAAEAGCHSTDRSHTSDALPCIDPVSALRPVLLLSPPADKDTPHLNLLAGGADAAHDGRDGPQAAV